ncbi:MAG: Txe/YoeB family addiction module toxin [Bacteroidales bacterium]|nr:Txe/YoeB family addiction module toxin [Bacteroidales bacterium]MBP5643177.1 Txe/YoeB family addiction module toxin [Bacteroidales bacterium]
MEVKYTPTALEDRDFWKRSGQKIVIEKITNLIIDISEHPTTGIGKPEQLKHRLSGLWSRRIDKENRIVYEIQENCVIIHSLRGHYN